MAAATPATYLRLCLCLLLLAAGGSAQAAGVALADAGAPGQSAAETQGHVMKVSNTAKQLAVARHQEHDVLPDEVMSASLPDLPQLVALAMERLEWGTACGDHSRAFLRALNNFTLWAVQMYDASVRAPSGVLYGSVYQLGHFEQCVLASAMDGRVRGQYCLPAVEVRPLPDQPQPLPQDPYSQTFQQDQSAWLKIQFAGDLLKIRRDRGWWAVCVPASCSPRQVQRGLDAALRVAGPRMRVQLRAQLRDDYCSTGESLQPGRSTVIFVCVVAVLLSLTVIGSCYDVHASKKALLMPEKKKGFGRQIMECFSVQRNFRKLITINKSNTDLDIFGFMRTFSIVCTITGHRVLQYAGFPLYNGEAVDRLFRHPAFMFFANGVVFADVFLTIGAMTAVTVLFHALNKGAKFYHLFLGIINRYVRLTPLYALLILFHCGVLPYTGSGPLWKSTVLREQTRCETNWWTNILYINNYVNPANMCMFQSWYMAADFHFFVVCLFLGYVMWRWPVVGWSVMACVTILSMVLPFLTIYLQNLDALVMPYPHVLKNFRESKEFLKLYIPSHNRAAPYLLGVMAGILVYHGKNLKWKLNEVSSYVVLIISWCMGIALVFSAYVFFIPGKPYSALDAAIYGALNHPAVAVLICLYGAIPVILHSKSLVNFLSARVFVILGRLSFAAYMVHTIPQLYDKGSLRQARHIDVYAGVWMAVADCCIMYPVAAALSVLVEAPFRALMKVLLQAIK